MADIIQSFPAGAGSGHTILDTDGTAVAQEKNLQFNGLSVTDDSVQGVTEVAPAGLNQDSLNDIAAAELPSSNAVGSGFNYSTTEQIIGRWIDGKPIYQKTFTSVLPTATTMGSIVYSYIDIGAQVETVIDQIGKFHTLNNGLWHDTIFDMDINSGWNYAVKSLVYDNSAPSNANKILVGNADTAWNGAPLHITIKYTKTTD